MDKKSKKWRRFAAVVCIGLGVMMGGVASPPVAQAGVGVVMDMRHTQVIPYKVYNFTPYRLELITENLNSMGNVRLAAGLPESIAPYPQQGCNAKIYALFVSYEGSGVWHPAYRTRASQGNYINIEFATDVEKIEVPSYTIDGLAFAMATFHAMNAIVSLAEPGPGYLETIMSLKDALDCANSVRQTNFTSLAGLGYVYGTSSGGSSMLINKNDCVAVQVGDGSTGEQLVLETVAVRQKPKVEWEGKTGHNENYDKMDASIISGGNQTALINIYTQAQYLSAKSIVLAGELLSGKAWEARLADELNQPDAAPYGIDAPAADMPTGGFGDMAAGGSGDMTAENNADGNANMGWLGSDSGSNANMGSDFAGNENRESDLAGAGDMGDGALNPKSAKMVKTLTQAILRLENGKYKWFSEKMQELKPGQRIDIYDALYWAQKKAKKGNTDNPLQPSSFRNEGAAFEGAAVGDISDQELEQKLEQALRNLNLAAEANSGAPEAQGALSGSFADRFNNGF